MQQLFIMRHAEALFDAPDAERTLSERGQQQAQDSARWLAEQCHGNIRLLASPLRRAQQTASYVADALSIEIESQQWLTPDTPLVDVMHHWDALWMAAAEHQRWIWVSHMPLVGRVSRLLVDGPLHRADGFDTAEVVGLNADAWGAGCAFRTLRHVPAPG